MRTDRDAVALPSLADEAGRLERFRPPFEFGDFFSPEDTLLCLLATEWALDRLAAERAASGGAPPRRIVELTSGSAVVALGPLDRRPGLRTWGADVDEAAVARAARNAHALGHAGRARFRHLGLFDRRLPAWLRRVRPDLVACNPPYVPEPPGSPLALVAGAGADGAEHPRRTLAACARAGVERLVLSWCSLGDPIGVARSAARRGYALEALWVCAIADGEYTGAAHGYMRTLPTAFLSERPATLAALASDGAARFGYLLLAGSFVRAAPAGEADVAPAMAAAHQARGRAGVRVVARLVRRFARRGLAGLGSGSPDAPGAEATADAGLPVHVTVCDRWGELALRAAAHGPAAGGQPDDGANRG